MKKNEEQSGRRLKNEPTDSDLLDWLDARDGAIEHQQFGEYRWYFEEKGNFKTAREVIRGAMQAKSNVEI